jgi:hypothetical protein
MDLGVDDIVVDPALPGLTLLHEDGVVYGAVERIGNGRWLAVTGSVVCGLFAASERVAPRYALGDQKGYWYSRDRAIGGLRGHRKDPGSVSGGKVPYMKPIEDRSLWGGND